MMTRAQSPQGAEVLLEGRHKGVMPTAQETQPTVSGEPRHDTSLEGVTLFRRAGHLEGHKEGLDQVAALPDTFSADMGNARDCYICAPMCNGEPRLCHSPTVCGVPWTLDRGE